MRSYKELVGKTDAELARVDPVEMNLLVAKSIPSLEHLEIGAYQRQVDEIAEGVRERLPEAEKLFRSSPQDWKNDLTFFHAGLICQHLDSIVGVAYKEDQRDKKPIKYINPSDLFLNGLLDTLRGTCASMPVLQVAISWRLGWPLSIACAKSHRFCRFDSDIRSFNVEATDTGRGGFSAPEDEFYVKEYQLTAKAISSGSDLRALTPREMFGLFVGDRARHMRDTMNFAEAELDYLLARHLFPLNRELHSTGTWVSIRRSDELFEDGEPGDALSIARVIQTEYARHRRPKFEPVPYICPETELYLRAPKSVGTVPWQGKAGS